MDYQASADEITRAKKLHAILLFDFIVIHIFVFIVALGMIKQSYIPLLLVPAISVVLLSLVITQGSRGGKDPSWFVRCHSLLAAKRAKHFLALYIVTGLFTLAMWKLGPAMGMTTIASLSLAFGLGQLPFMIGLLFLVVVEYDAEHQCKLGKVPKAGQSLQPALEGQV